MVENLITLSLQVFRPNEKLHISNSVILFTFLTKTTIFNKDVLRQIEVNLIFESYFEQNILKLNEGIQLQ